MEKIRKSYVAPQAETYDMELSGMLALSIDKSGGGGGNTPEAPMYYPLADIEDIEDEEEE